MAHHKSAKKRIRRNARREEINGARIAVVGQAFPRTANANPQEFFPDWSFGLREPDMIELVGFARYLGWGCLFAVLALVAGGLYALDKTGAVSVDSIGRRSEFVIPPGDRCNSEANARCLAPRLGPARRSKIDKARRGERDKLCGITAAAEVRVLLK